MHCRRHDTQSCLRGKGGKEKEGTGRPNIYRGVERAPCFRQQKRSVSSVLRTLAKQQRKGGKVTFSAPAERQLVLFLSPEKSYVGNSNKRFFVR